jgi:asparagine N-glycosylation enzyme membrane subunit Stt3
MTHDTITAVERAGMVVFATIVILALPIIGLLNTVGGSMSGMVEYMEGDAAGYALAQSAVPEAAEITATPVVGPNTRAALLAFGLVLFALLALYRFVSISGTEPDAAPVPAGD